MDKNNKLGSLKKRSEFLYVRDGRYKAQGGVVVQMRETPPETPPETHQASGAVSGEPLIRVGFTATKRIGNAVVRNRAKRRLRALARCVLPQYGLPGYDYVFIARNNTHTRAYDALLDDCSKALLSLRDYAQKTDIKTTRNKTP